MTALVTLALILRMQDTSLNVAQRNNACYQLRGVASAQVVGNMRAALKDSLVRACAGLNLRAANAVPELKDAISDSDYEVRAIAARLLGSFEKPELLPLIAKAARDPQLIVATNAVEGLSNYRDQELVMPYLLDLAKDGGIVGTAALNRALELAVDQSDPRTITVARGLLQHSDVSDKLAAMRVLAQRGDSTDLPTLREIIKNDAGEVAGQSRGFGFVPAISLSRAAQTTISSIEKRAAEKRAGVTVTP
jgi:HEAT repeat protein